MNTCSKPGFLLSFSQMAVGVKVGLGSRWWVRRFGPTFPLNEVGNPALSQGGRLCHMVPHGLRDTWTEREVESEVVTQEIQDISSSKCKNKLKGYYHLRRIWQVLQTHGCRHSSSSLLEIFLTLESFQPPQISPARQIGFWAKLNAQKEKMFCLV